MQGTQEHRIVSIRPGKAVSAGSFVGMIFMLLFGAGFTVLVANVLFSEDAPLGVIVLFFIFMVGWMGMAAYMLVYHLLNWKSAHGVPLFEVEVAAGSAEEAAAAAADLVNRRAGRDEPKA